MAQPLICDLCNSEPGVLMVTNVTTGDVQAIGGACLHPWALAFAASTDPEGVPEPADEEPPEAATDPEPPELADQDPPAVPARNGRKPRAGTTTEAVARAQTEPAPA